MSTRKQSPSRRRRKVFTGCWTCRRRHLKCDETKPHCNRCERSNLPCEGYAVRLAWITETSSEDGDKKTTSTYTAGNRRLLMSSDTGTEANPVLDAKQYVRSIQSGLRKQLSKGSSSASGPFHIFRVTQTDPLTPGGKAATPCSPSVEPQQEVISVESNESSDDRTDNIFVDNCLENEILMMAGLGMDGNLFDRGQQHGDDFPTALVGGADFGQGIVAPLVAEAAVWSSIRHWDLFRTPSQQETLLNHWRVYVCPKMVGSGTSNEALKQTFIPLAIRGMQCSAQMPDFGAALFHAICAGSAYSLATLCGGGDSAEQTHYKTLAVKHEQLALSLFRHSLSRGLYQDPYTIIALLVALLISDDVSGQPGNWHHGVQSSTHWLEAYVRNNPPPWAVEPLQQEFLQLLVSTILLCGLHVEEAVLGYFIKNAPPCPDVVQLGMHPQLIDAYQRVAKHLASNSNCDADIDDLEQHLTLAYLTTICDHESTLQNERTPGPVTASYYNLSMVYYGLFLYFKRECRHVAPDQLQDIVEAGLASMEQCFDAGGTSLVPAAWSSLFILSECTKPRLQKRALAWFARVEKLGFRAITTRRLVCLSVWEQRRLAPAGVDVRWQNVGLNDEVFDFCPA